MSRNVGSMTSLTRSLSNFYWSSGKLTMGESQCHKRILTTLRLPWSMETQLVKLAKWHERYPATPRYSSHPSPNYTHEKVLLNMIAFKDPRTLKARTHQAVPNTSSYLSPSAEAQDTEVDKRHATLLHVSPDTQHTGHSTLCKPLTHSIHATLLCVIPDTQHTGHFTLCKSWHTALPALCQYVCTWLVIQQDNGGGVICKRELI